MDEHELDRCSARLTAAYDPAGFARETTAAAAQLRDYLAAVLSGDGAVWPGTPPDRLLDHWPAPDASGGDDLQRLLGNVIAQSTHQHHPGFVGQQLSAPPPLVGPVALVSAILNNSAAIFEGAPVGIVVERRIVRWMADLAGYDDSSGGILTSGGSLGALTALLAMRQARLGYDVWDLGMSGAGRPAILMSREAHYCNRRACAVLGFGERAVLPVDTNSRFEMDLPSLEETCERARADGLRPIAVVANAGSTATGSYDDLDAIATFCAARDLWLHVDAAHGGSALLSPRHAGRLRGVHRADSIVWDAHKMLLMPSMCTTLLVRNRAHLDAAFRQQASYLLSGHDEAWYEPARRNFETTKPLFVLPLYVALRTLGSGFFADAVAYAYDLAAEFAAAIGRRDDFELLVPPQSNIVCFRHRAPADRIDTLQHALRDAVNRSGRFFVMRTSVRGATWLRVVLMSPATRLQHLRGLLDELSASARAFAGAGGEAADRSRT